MTPFSKEDYPPRLHRAVDLANQTISELARGWTVLDEGFVNAQAEAVDRLLLYDRTRRFPNQIVQDDLGGLYGFVPLNPEPLDRVPTPIERLCLARQKAKTAGHWGEADRLRALATAAHYELGDAPEGTEWFHHYWLEWPHTPNAPSVWIPDAAIEPEEAS